MAFHYLSLYCSSNWKKSPLFSSPLSVTSYVIWGNLSKPWFFHQFSSVQLLSRVRLFVTPWIAARQASLSISNSRSSHKLTSIESVMPSSHLILCRPLLLLPPIPPSIRVFSNESTLGMRWPKYCKVVQIRVLVLNAVMKIKRDNAYKLLNNC